MITDKETNKLYLSPLLEEDYPRFFQNFKTAIDKHGIKPHYLPKTKDVWCVDFMPIQIGDSKFVQFSYKPDYLREYPNLRTKPQDVLVSIGIDTIPSNIILDGGNVVRSRDKVIMCDKVFYENKNVSIRDLTHKLKEYFEIDKLIFIPWNKDDFTGHADGMVRFIDNNTVLINEYSKYENYEFQVSLRTALYNAGLDYIELPCYLPDDPTGVSARGLYLNFLQMEQAIFIPVFKGLEKTNEKAEKIITEAFKGTPIVSVESTQLSKQGGILNCISWNIKSYE